jgi:hypothetical protein
MAEHDFSALAARVQRLEDELAILRLMATYGPAVDSGAGAVAGSLWHEDGSYDLEAGIWNGPSGIAEMVAGDIHQGFVHNGCAHVISPPMNVVDGDTAVATCHSLLLLRRAANDDYVVPSVRANRWEFARTPAGWRVTHRKNRLLDGGDVSVELFRRGVQAV